MLNGVHLGARLLRAGRGASGALGPSLPEEGAGLTALFPVVPARDEEAWLGLKSASKTASTVEPDCCGTAAALAAAAAPTGALLAMPGRGCFIRERAEAGGGTPADVTLAVGAVVVRDAGGAAPLVRCSSMRC